MLSTGPDDRRTHMARSSVVVMGAFVASKLVGLLRERAIAHRLGAGADYDAYVAAFNIPDLLFTLIAGGALVSAFLPVFSEALAKQRRDEAWQLASAITNLVFLVTLVLAAAAAILAPELVAQVLAPGFSASQQALTVDLMRIILVSTLLFSISGIQMGILNALQHFLLPAVAPIVYNLGILIGALWLTPRWGVRGLAYGVVLGALFHLLVKVPGLIHYGFSYRATFGLSLPGVRQVAALMWPRVLALATVKAVFLVNVRLASQLPGGSLSAFNYAWVISQMPQTVLGTAVATVAFPTLAELAALGDRDQLRSTIAGTLRLLAALTVPAAVLMWVLAGPAIAVLLQTGRFGAEAAAATEAALKMFALGLVGHVALEVVARGFYAGKDTLTPLLGAAVAMVLNIALAVALASPLGHSGLALANSLAVTTEVVLLALILRRRLGGSTGTLVPTAARILSAGVATALAAEAAITSMEVYLDPIDLLGPLVGGVALVGLGATAGGAAYVGTGLLVGMPELASFRRLARQIVSRST